MMSNQSGGSFNFHNHELSIKYDSSRV